MDRHTFLLASSSSLHTFSSPSLPHNNHLFSLFSLSFVVVLHQKTFLPEMATMLALNAPPGQGPVIQPFVHYRCLCSSPGPSATASRTPSTTRTATPTRTTNKDDKDIDIDPTTTPTNDTAPFQDLVPAAAALTLHQHHHHHSLEHEQSKAHAEVYDSGNNSDPHGSHSLSRLYFCDSCDEIRCPKCTQDEIVCYYCPNCLFDVPTASVKSDKHKYATLWPATMNWTSRKEGKIEND